MEEKNIPIIRLETVAGGALQEIAQDAIAEVAKNLQDINTPWKKKRTVTIQLGFTQNENRNDVTMTMYVKPDLAPPKPIETKFSIGTDLKDGSIYMEEYGPQIKGQMSLGDYNVMPDARADTETSKVTDFRAKDASVDIRGITKH